jgi:hypothetical protein
MLPAVAAPGCCPPARGTPAGRAASACRPLRTQQPHRIASSSHTLHESSSEPQCSYRTDGNLRALPESLVSRAAGKGKRALRKLKALAQLSKQR